MGKGDDGIRRRKDGRFEARYTAQTATGPKRRSETEAEAKAKRDRARAEGVDEAGSPVDAGSMAVGALPGFVAERQRQGPRSAQHVLPA